MCEKRTCRVIDNKEINWDGSSIALRVATLWEKITDNKKGSNLNTEQWVAAAAAQTQENWRDVV